jgi:hypothetical protein
MVTWLLTFVAARGHMAFEAVPPRTDLDVLKLSGRAYKSLRRAGIKTVDDVAALSDERLHAIPGVGAVTVAEVRQKLSQFADSQTAEGSARARPRSADASQTPVEALELSSTLKRLLQAAGIATVADLTQLPLGLWVSEDQISQSERQELEQRLTAFLAAHPDALPEPLQPVVSADLMARVAQAPLDHIPPQRLGLPPELSAQVAEAGIESVGQMLRRPYAGLVQARVFRDYLERYFTWLADQSADTWPEEVAAQGISPLHRLALSESSLETLTFQWLSPLDDEKKTIILWRYGISEQRVKRKAIARRMGIGRQQVKHLRDQALTMLKAPEWVSVMEPLRASVVHALREADGLLAAPKLAQVVKQQMKVGRVDPVGVMRLLAKTSDDIRWVGRARLFGLTSCPVKRVVGVQKRLLRRVRRRDQPPTVAELLADVKTSRYYAKREAELSDSFILACLNNHPELSVEGQYCIPTQYAGEPVQRFVRALRELDRPTHFARVAQRANRRLAAERRTPAPTVHAYLKNRPDLFVHVAEGIFGLRDWGGLDDFDLTVPQ